MLTPILSHRLEFIVSYSQGHTMMTVATGLIDGPKIMELFDGARKKKVFIYLPPASRSITGIDTCYITQ